MKPFFDTIRPMFGGAIKQSQVDGCNVILKASEGLPVAHRAYLLATAFHETAKTMQPVRETLAKSDESAVNVLEKSWKAGKLKWVRTPYWRYDQEGKSWLGRGYVQLTHKDNYAKAAKKLNVDLLGNPAIAMKADVAAQILVKGSCEGWFTGKTLDDYLPEDFEGARRVINGTDKAKLIAGYARSFEAALRVLPIGQGDVENKGGLRGFLNKLRRA